MLRRTVPAVALAVLVGAVLAVPAAQAFDHTYDVVDTSDAGPFGPTNDGVCASVATGNPCTLRAAVAEVNGTGVDSLVQLKAATYKLSATGALQMTLGVGTKVEFRGVGAGQTTIDAQGNGRVMFENGAGVTLTLNALTITGGAVFDNGGGIWINRSDVKLIDAAMTGNTADGNGASGGGIFESGTGTEGNIEVTRSTIAGNKAVASSSDSAGGGIWTSGPSVTVTDSRITSNTAGFNALSTGRGAGIEATQSEVRITRSSITGNEAVAESSVSSSAIGGGIETGNLTLSDSTVAGNLAGTPNGTGIGAGLAIVMNGAAAGSAAVTGTTIAGNRTMPFSDTGGNVFVQTTGLGATVTLRNSIVAGGTGPFGHENCSGNVVSQGGNVEDRSPAQCGGGANDKVGVGPMLGPFDSSAKMFPLTPSSPAIDFGVAPCTGTDQRGAGRPSGAACDSGAFEVQGGADAFSSAAYGAGEGTGQTVVTVTRGGGTLDAGTDRVVTEGGTATAGADYTPVDTTLSFAAGQASADVAVPILEDGAVEGPETVGLRVIPGPGASAGAPSTTTLTITDDDVASAPPPTLRPDRTAPVESALAVAPSAFRPAGSGGSIAAKKKKTPVGSRISYRLSERATTTFTVQRIQTGRRVKGKCVRLTRANKRARKCLRFVAVKGSFTQAGAKGINRFRFTGRLDGKPLRRGSYQLTGVPRDPAGNRGRPVTARFKIVK
jgi:hypothetical protein